MADTEMIDCPFCGSDECTVEQVKKGWYSAICDNCEAEGPPAYSNKDARLAWNGRPKQYAESANCNGKPEQALASRPAEVDDTTCDLCKGTGETRMRAAGAVWHHTCARCKGNGSAPSRTTNKEK